MLREAFRIGKSGKVGLIFLKLTQSGVAQQQHSARLFFVPNLTPAQTMTKTLFPLSGLVAALFALNSLSVYADKNPPKKSPLSQQRSINPAGVKLPAGFSAAIVAENLGTPRHIVISKTGDIYVKLAKLKDGKGIYRLRDTNNDGVVDERVGFGDYPGTGIFLNNSYLYASSNNSIYR